MVAHTKRVNGILLLYHHWFTLNAPTIMEHVNSFKYYSQFMVWPINTALGFPIGLSKFEFQIIVLHYSAMGFVPDLPNPCYLNESYLHYLKRSECSHKIAFFQDEYHYCQQRFSFLNRFNVDCVYTLLAPAYFKDVYQKYTNVPKLMHTLTGYVSDDLIKKAQKYAKPYNDRKIDVGYRTRQLPLYMGKGAQEKHEIAVRFREYSKGLELRLDIETTEGKRLYGDAWYRFLGDCKACLGVEAGVSIFDLEDEVRIKYEELSKHGPVESFAQMPKELLDKWENNIPYRTISPRHFEAAAFRVCQILYEGEYQGIMRPMVHYIPLKKDFSNFDEVIRLLRDNEFRQQITDNCYRDLIASEKYSYQSFIGSFDQELMAAGLKPEIPQYKAIMVSLALNWDKTLRVLHRYFINIVHKVLSYEFPGRRAIVPFGRPAYNWMRRCVNKQSGR